MAWFFFPFQHDFNGKNFMFRPTPEFTIILIIFAKC